jgi:squalene synthase HpnC
VRYLLPEDFVYSHEALSRSWGRADAESYTRWLATTHYENFHVVSFLLPKRLHQDFYNVYAFCRWADDLGDEIANKSEALRLLEWWRTLLNAMYEGEAWHPVYVALAGTVRKYGLPRQLFIDLIDAFVQDQTVGRYGDWEELYGYCRRSANPVGRLVLYLCGYRDEERHRLSDFTCTALQLANFWQDVSVDLLKDRVYIPAEVMQRYGYSADDLFAQREDDAFRAVMKDVIGYTRGLFLEGLPLVSTVDRRLSIDLDLFSQGGLRILEKIESINYNVLRQRPAIGKLERVGILLGTIVRGVFRSAA